MKTTAKLLALPALLLALSTSQTNLEAQTSGCTNGPNYVDGLGDTLTQFACNIYPSTAPFTIDLTPNLTYDGADEYPNLIAPGYAVVINGDPNALSDDSSGLWNQSLWTTVLYWPADTDGGYASDEITVYYAGNAGFPSAATVMSYDQGLYGTGFDSYFFAEAGNPAVYGAGGNDVYNIYPVPESSSLLFLGICLLVLAAAIVLKVRASGMLLNS